MKRKFINLGLVIFCVLSLLGCSSKKEPDKESDSVTNSEDSADSAANPSGITVEELEEQRTEKEITQANDREKFWNSFEEDIPMKQVEFGSYDIYETTATRMVERIENKDTFVLLILHSQNKAKESEKEIFTKIGYEVVPDYPLYYVEEDYGYDTYAEEMNSIEPLLPYLVSDDESKDNFLSSPYHYGIYEFVNGELVICNKNIQSYDPENMDEDTIKSMENTVEHDMRLIIGNLPSTYNFETIFYTKQELESYLKDNPNCVLFVGRDSCPYCPSLRRDLCSFIDRCEWTVPVAYFCAQKYAIAELIYGSSSVEYNNSNLEWEGLKSVLTVDYIPVILTFKDGEVVQNYTNNTFGENLYNSMVEDGTITSFKPGKEVDWTLKYSEGNPKNNEAEENQAE